MKTFLALTTSFILISSVAIAEESRTVIHHETTLKNTEKTVSRDPAKTMDDATVQKNQTEAHKHSSTTVTNDQPGLTSDTEVQNSTATTEKSSSTTIESDSTPEVASGETEVRIRKKETHSSEITTQ